LKSTAAEHWLIRLAPTALRGGSNWRPEFLLTVLAAVCVAAIHRHSVWSAFVIHHQGGGELRVQCVVPIVSAWLIWSRRRLLESMTVRVWWPGLLAVAAASVLWLLADRADVDALRQLAVIAMLQAVVLTLLGWALARALALPLLFLFFSIDAFLLPLAPPLLNATASLGVAMLRASGVAVMLDGLAIETPFGKWLMTDNCSGIEYMAVYAMAAVLFASLAVRSFGRRIALVLAALLAALLANGLRVWSIVFATYVNGGVDPGHEVLGWLSFATPLAIFLFIARRFADPIDEGALPRGRFSHHEAGAAGSVALAAVAAIAIVGLAPAWAAAVQTPAAGGTLLGGCRTVAQEIVHREGAGLARTRAVCVGAAGRAQLGGVPLLPLENVAPDSIRARSTTSVIEPGRDGAIQASVLTTLDGPVPYRLTYWYEVGGHATGSRIQMRLRLALAMLQDRDTPVTVVSDLQQLRDPARP